MLQFPLDSRAALWELSYSLPLSLELPLQLLHQSRNPTIQVSTMLESNFQEIGLLLQYGGVVKGVIHLGKVQMSRIGLHRHCRLAFSHDSITHLIHSCTRMARNYLKRLNLVFWQAYNCSRPIGGALNLWNYRHICCNLMTYQNGSRYQNHFLQGSSYVPEICTAICSFNTN